MKFIRWFDTLRMEDIPLVGGKNAALGEMISHLQSQGVSVPRGFAVTAQAYWYFLESNDIRDAVFSRLSVLHDVQDIEALEKVGSEVRALIEAGKVPDDLAQELVIAYHALSAFYNQKQSDVAVRSSATAEDLPTASFAGQQETFLNVRSDTHILAAYVKSLASLFTNRAISYRHEHGFAHDKVGLSVGIQKMIRSDKASSGVAFSLDTETGFADIVMIDSAYGLGEGIVKGLANPDEFWVFKPTLEKGFKSIIKKQRGDKKIKVICGAEGDVKQAPVSARDQHKFSLTDDEVLQLARLVIKIEKYYSARNKRWTPMDIEWAKDGVDGKIYIIQARPETIHSQKSAGDAARVYSLSEKVSQDRIITTGQSIGQKIISGTARVIVSVDQLSSVQEGDIMITRMTDPDWVPVMKKAAGIVTDLGGRTCHAAIVSRELGTPAIVGTNDASQKIKDGQTITIDCSQGSVGFVYDGAVSSEVRQIDYASLGKPPVKLLVNIADPDTAIRVGFLPVDGVGLARIEFIISNAIKIHPMALLYPEKVTNKKNIRDIELLTSGYDDKKQFFIDTLAQGVAMIAAAFYPRNVIVRLSDFKTNEYRNLLGGEFFESQEANPMLGFRGASRYTHEQYREAFALECEALVTVRKNMGLDNVSVMVPFVRTIAEAQRTIAALHDAGLTSGDGLSLVMMCEVPSNVLLIEEFSALFDGFSIGSNDLTQLILGVDRDSAQLAEIFDERDPAVKKMIVSAIEGAHRNNRFIGICGQGPSDYPELAQFLIEHKIDSISLNPDSVLPFLLRYGKE